MLQPHFRQHQTDQGQSGHQGILFCHNERTRFLFRREDAEGRQIRPVLVQSEAHQLPRKLSRFSGKDGRYVFGHKTEQPFPFTTRTGMLITCCRPPCAAAGNARDIFHACPMLRRMLV